MMTLPFYRLSSYNRVGGRTHPIVSRRMNQVMDMWASLMSKAEIATELSIDVDTVRNYVRRARRRGDPRANRPDASNKIILKARVRKLQMKILDKAGFTKHEIASRIGVDVRLVEMRLRETA